MIPFVIAVMALHELLNEESIRALIFPGIKIDFIANQGTQNKSYHFEPDMPSPPHNDERRWKFESVNCSNWALATVSLKQKRLEPVSNSTLLAYIHRVNQIAESFTDSSFCVLATILTSNADDSLLKELLVVELEKKIDHPTLTKVVWFTKRNFDHWFGSTASVSMRDFYSLCPFQESPTAARNWGYIYAILHGAKLILEIPTERLEVDYGRPWWSNVLAQIFQESIPKTLSVASVGLHLFNPFPLLLNMTSSIPNGFPLEYRKNSVTYGTIAFAKKRPVTYQDGGIYQVMKISHAKTWIERFQQNGFVTQYVAAPQQTTKSLRPDNDAMIEGILVPSHAFSPYSLHPDKQPGFLLSSSLTLWALLLPLSLPSESSSEIWRSYLSQALFRDTGSRVLFRLFQDNSPLEEDGQESAVNATFKSRRLSLPLVERSRPHTYTQKNQSRTKTARFIEFLEQWSSSSIKAKEDSHWTIDERMECLWQDLVREGFLTQRDAQLARVWRKLLLQSLATSRFEDNLLLLPEFRPRICNVLVMGQFNYGHIPVENVIFWVQKYREYFCRVMVSGPFSNATMRELNYNGILARAGPNDSGTWAPLNNLMLTLEDEYARRLGYMREENNHSSVSKTTEGVLYVHDDALLNLSYIKTMGIKGELRNYQRSNFPTKHIVGTELTLPLNFGHTSYKNPRTAVRGRDDLLLRRSYKIHGNGSLFSLLDSNQTFTDFEQFKKSLIRMAKWPHYWRCLDGQLSVVKNSNSSKYREPDGSVLFSPFVQADFLYVPIQLAPEFAQAARLHLQKPPVFLECSVPTVVDMVRRTTNASVTTLNLCSKFGSVHRGTPTMIVECIRDETLGKDSRNVGVFHPYKLSRGLEDWNDMFNAIAG